MRTIINAVEELICNKKSQQRYHQEEADRIGRQMAQNSYEIMCLEQELDQLKKSQEPITCQS